MAYKCLGCGHVFEEGEEWRAVESHGEGLTGCPVCKEAYEPTVVCLHCGGEYLEDELYDGWCESCLQKQISYDLFMEYLKHRSKQENALSEFMFEKFFDTPTPEHISDKLNEHLEWEYRRQTAKDKLLEKMEFLDLCIQYVMTDDGECGRQCYAEWLSNRAKI